MPTVDGAVLERAGLSEADLADAQADARRRSFAHIHGLVFAESLPNVCESFGTRDDDGTNLADKLTYLSRFAANHLDFRQGRPRAEATIPNLTEWQVDALGQLGDELDMTGSSNAFGVNADLYISDGTYRQGINGRLLLLRDHLDVQSRMYPDATPIVVAATNERPVAEPDKIRPISFAPYARTERHIVEGGFAYILGAEKPVDDPTYPGARHYELPDGLHGITSAMPTKQDGRLPTSADVQEYAAQVIGPEKILGATVVGMSTQVYVPFHKADLLRTWGLEYGARVHMVGFRDPTIAQPHHIGQEYKSAIDESTFLYQAVLQQLAKPKGIRA